MSEKLLFFNIVHYSRQCTFMHRAEKIRENTKKISLRFIQTNKKFLKNFLYLVLKIPKVVYFQLTVKTTLRSFGQSLQKVKILE